MNKEIMELLAPAGSLEIFKAVIRAGADAVYVGGSAFGARAYANNFNQEEMFEALDYAYLRGKKVYMTVNTLMKNQEIKDKLYDFLVPYYEHGLDAVIVQDFGAVTFLRKHFPNLHVHASTQTTIAGVEGARLMKNLGATRIVTAREMNLQEIKKIHDEVGVEIETFAHGALCYCYSGQCLFSSMLGGRSGNRGRCAQPCRLGYSVLDKNKEQYMKEKFVLSPKDQALIEYLPKMIEAGVFSLKIEGRMKQANYAAGVVSIYRKYLDKAIELYENNKMDQYKVSQKDMQKLLDLGNRCGFTDGYLREHNGKDMITFAKPNHEKTNDALQTQITETYVNTKDYLPITGKAYFRCGKEATLIVKCGKHTVKVLGQVVDVAKNKPQTYEDIDKRLKKTKESSFEFKNLEIEMDDNIFMPNGALNKLRRDALEQLEREILENNYRDLKADQQKAAEKQESNQKISFSTSRNRIKEAEIVCAIEDRNMLNDVLKYEFVSDVYLDSTCYERKNLDKQLKEDVQKIVKANKKAYFILPAIYRKSTSEFYHSKKDVFEEINLTGFVIKNFEELELFKDSDKKVVLDHNMYTYNDIAEESYLNLGADMVTVPLELNHNEIRHRKNSNSEMIVYGYYPLMTSAQCVHKNTYKCDKKKTVTYLNDRYNKLFPVKNQCEECYNVIYNSLPTCLFEQIEELKKMDLHRFRVNFTIESNKQMNNILSTLRMFLEGKVSKVPKEYLSDFTKGHYKRGVE